MADGSNAFLGMPIGDLATWAGAIGSVFAALAALYAAKTAIKLARLPVEQQDNFKRAEARTIAAGVRRDLLDARTTLLLLRQMLKCLESPSVASLTISMGYGRMKPVPMIEKFLADFGAFGEEDAGKLMSASADILNFTPWIEQKIAHLNEPVLQELYKEGYTQSVLESVRFEIDAVLRNVELAIEVVDHRCGLKSHSLFDGDPTESSGEAAKGGESS